MRTYSAAFADLPDIITPTVRAGVDHAWHLYPIRLVSGRAQVTRNQFIEELATRGIGASVHFIPVHLHPFYRETFGCKRGDLPVTERVYDEFVSLPLYPGLRPHDVERVTQAVRAILAVKATV